MVRIGGTIRYGVSAVISNNEYNILLTIWKAGHALSAQEIVENMEDKSFKDRTIHSILTAMLEKGLIFVDGQRLSSRIYCRLFNTSLSFEQFQSRQIMDSPVYRQDKAQVLPGILSALVEDEDVGPDTLDKLEALLKERKKRLRDEADGI